MENNWILISDKFPNSGDRCLVTDDEIIIIATYVVDTDNHHWILSGIADAVSETFSVQRWMPLPNLPKKIVSSENQ